MALEYPLILISLTFVAFILHQRFKIKLFKNLKHAVLFYLIFISIGVAWDNFAIYRGHWFYPGKGISGIFIGYMPLEDYFFIPVCSYFGLVLYRILEQKS